MGLNLKNATLFRPSSVLHLILQVFHENILGAFVWVARAFVQWGGGLNVTAFGSVLRSTAFRAVVSARAVRIFHSRVATSLFKTFLDSSGWLIERRVAAGSRCHTAQKGVVLFTSEMGLRSTRSTSFKLLWWSYH